MRRGQGGERTQARKTGPRAPVSTRRPVGPEQGEQGGVGLGLPHPLDSWPRGWECGVCTQGTASEDPFEGGVKNRPLPPALGHFLTPGAHTCPRPSLGPSGVLHLKSKVPANKEPLLPRFVPGPWCRERPTLMLSVLTGS